MSRLPDSTAGKLPNSPLSSEKASQVPAAFQPSATTKIYDRYGYLLYEVFQEGRRTELTSLEARLRHRESLPGIVHPSLSQRMNVGVRALFSGPSGTGKSQSAEDRPSAPEPPPARSRTAHPAA